MKNIYTLSINDFSYMTELKDYRRMSWYWMPKVYKENAYNSVMLDFMNMIQPQELLQHITTETIKLRLYNLSENYLPAMYISLRNKFTPEMANEFESMFGFRPKSIVDLKIILEKIEATRRKYKAYAGNQTETNPEPKGNVIEQLITGIELTLNLSINRNLSVYQLKYYYENSMNKIKQLEKHGNNR